LYPSKQKKKKKRKIKNEYLDNGRDNHYR
jgi:hypothetical protein